MKLLKNRAQCVDKLRFLSEIRTNISTGRFSQNGFTNGLLIKVPGKCGLQRNYTKVNNVFTNKVSFLKGNVFFYGYNDFCEDKKKTVRKLCC